MNRERTLISTRIRTSAAALALALGVALGVAGPSHAATYYYDGKDPYNTGCDYNSYVAKSAKDTYYSSKYGETVSVTASLWYSPGCRTVWAMVDSTVPDSYWAGLGCNVWRNSDMKREGCSVQTGTREWYSMMLNDKNLTSFATAWGFIGDDSHEMFARTGSY